MPTLGAVASSFRFSGKFLDIAEDIDTIRTTNRIYLRNDAGDNEWSFGMDSSRNWTLRNEQRNEDTISSDIDSQKVTIFDLSGGGGAVTDLSDLNDVNTSNVQKGSVMYYDNLTSTYDFTDTLRFLKANSEWDIQNVPLRFSGGDLNILQDPTDLLKNINIGGIPRQGQISDGKSIAIGAGAGATNQKEECLAIGFNAGLIGQGNGIFTTGSSIAIGHNSGSIEQQHNSLAIGFGAGYSNQFASCIAIGEDAGSISQRTNSLAIGFNAGKNNQLQSSIAIGPYAGLSSQGEYSVHIGTYAGNVGASAYSIGIGWEANTLQAGINSIAIGKEAGRNNLGQNSIAIGTSAGKINSGTNCIFLGEAAGLDGGNFTNVIVLNASSTELDPTDNSKCYINPISPATSGNILQYNATTKEVTYEKTVSNIDITNSLTLNQQTGVSGEVLISQGASAPIYAPIPTPASSSIFGSFTLPSNLPLTSNTSNNITTLINQPNVTPTGMSIVSSTGIITLTTAGVYLINASFRVSSINGAGGLYQSHLFLTQGNATNTFIGSINEFIDQGSGDSYKTLTPSGHIVLFAPSNSYSIRLRIYQNTIHTTQLVGGNSSAGISILKIG